MKMKVKELKELLNKIPDDSNISMEWDDFHIAVKYLAYDEELKEEIWHVENSIKYVINHRNKFPEKLRFRFEKNDDDYYECIKEK